MAQNKFQNLKVNPGAKSSRFVIDLKKNSLEEDKQKTKSLVYNLNDNFRGLFIRAAKTETKKKVKKNIKRSRINKSGQASLLSNLAVVEIGKLIFMVLRQFTALIYKICYLVGWVLVFLCRLAFIILAVALKPVIKLIKKIFVKSAAGIKAKKSLIKKPSPKYFTEKIQPANSYEQKFSYLKPVLVFAVVLLIIILPVKAFTYYRSIDEIKGKVLGASESAVDDLIAGGKLAANLDFKEADRSFTQAGSNFLAAKNQLEEIDNLIFVLASVAPNKNMRLAAASKNIVKAGNLSARAGKNLSLAFESLFNYESNGADKILTNLIVYGREAITDLKALTGELEQINSDVIPEDYRAKFIILKQKSESLLSGLSQFIGLAENLENFLGMSALKRYLLIFQNNSELRASGGFLGSFAIIDFLNGEIKNIRVPGGGSYDTEAGLLKKIKSPEPLRLISPDWYFWDANWWPDWKMSAKKLAWFYENSDGSTVDGVIGFTPTVMERLLKIIGPIDLKEKYGVIIDAENFWLVTQEFAEQKLAVTREPKKIIGDLMNKIIEELPKRLNKNNLIPLLKIIEESFGDKNILFYFTDDELQTEIENLGWAGRIKETTGDYINVVNTNIAGGKSDRKIKQQIIHRAEIQADGAIIDSLTIKRTHEAVKREPFCGVRNVDWLRIYVPLGSKLISTSGFKPVDKIFFKTADENWQDDPEVMSGEGQAIIEAASGTKIYNELGKTVFANWSQLDPGESIEINIKYELPFKLALKNMENSVEELDRLIAKANKLINPEQKDIYAYSLLAQKQPGMNSSAIISELKLAGNFNPIWKYPENLAVNQGGWFRTEDFNQDKLMAILLERE